MALSFGVTLLSLAVLMLGVSIEISDTKEVCTVQLVNREILDTTAEVNDITNTKAKHKRISWQWVARRALNYLLKQICVVGSRFTVDYELDDEEPNRRVRRGWGSRRRSSSSSSSSSSSRSWGSRRSSSSSSRSSSRSRGSRRSSSSSSRSSSRSWGSRRRSPTSSSRSRATSNVRISSRSGQKARTSSLSSRRRTIFSGRTRRIGRVGSSKEGSSSGKRSKQNPKPKRKLQKSAVLDKVHTALDIAGMVPGIGNVADGINAGLHAARGNWKDAALSAAGMIPGAGQAATAAKLAKKSSKVIKGSTKAIKGSTKVIKGTKKVIKGIKGKLLKESKNLKEFLERAVVTNTKKKGKTIAKTDESYDVAKKIFQKETGVKPKDTGLTHARTKDGKYHLTVRDYSSKGDKTLDVKDMKTGHVTKTRCLGGSCDGPKK